MVTEEEIEAISKLMKIKITDHHEYVDKVHAMLDFFEMLDSAGADDEEVPLRRVPISCLREDRHVAFDGHLVDELKHFRDGYIRAPRMN